MAESNINAENFVQPNYGAEIPAVSVDEIHIESVNKLGIETLGEGEKVNSGQEPVLAANKKKGINTETLGAGEKPVEPNSSGIGEGVAAAEGQAEGSTTKVGTVAEVGEKRERPGGEVAGEEQEKAEKEAGKEIKKPKTGTLGAEEKPHEGEKGPTQAKKGKGKKAAAKPKAPTTETEKKKRPVGRPRKNTVAVPMVLEPQEAETTKPGEGASMGTDVASHHTRSANVSVHHTRSQTH